MTQKLLLRKAIFAIKALRITEWRAYVGMAFYGALYNLSDFSNLLNTLPTLTAGVFLYMSSAYLANNIFDAEGDCLNKKKSTKNPFTTNSLSPAEGLVLLLITSSLGVLLILIVTDLPTSISYLVGLSLALMYSIPPIRLKERTPLDLISHSIFFGIALVLFGFYLNGNSSLNIYLLIITALYSAILELRNEIEDIDVDKEAGYCTTAVVLGYERSIKLLKVLLGVFVLTSFLSLYKIHPLIVVFLATYLIIVLIINSSFDRKIRLMDIYAITYYLIVLFFNIIL